MIYNLKKSPWFLVRKRTIPTERPQPAGEVSANMSLKSLNGPINIFKGIYYQISPKSGYKIQSMRTESQIWSSLHTWSSSTRHEDGIIRIWARSFAIPELRDSVYSLGTFFQPVVLPVNTSDESTVSFAHSGTVNLNSVGRTKWEQLRGTYGYSPASPCWGFVCLLPSATDTRQ
jgi:hypothetical protein